MDPAHSENGRNQASFGYESSKAPVTSTGDESSVIRSRNDRGGCAFRTGLGPRNAHGAGDAETDGLPFIKVAMPTSRGLSGLRARPFVRVADNPLGGGGGVSENAAYGRQKQRRAFYR